MENYFFCKIDLCEIFILFCVLYYFYNILITWKTYSILYIKARVASGNPTLDVKYAHRRTAVLMIGAPKLQGPRTRVSKNSQLLFFLWLFIHLIRAPQQILIEGPSKARYATEYERIKLIINEYELHAQ